MRPKPNNCTVFSRQFLSCCHIFIPFYTHLPIFPDGCFFRPAPRSRFGSSGPQQSLTRARLPFERAARQQEIDFAISGGHNDVLSVSGFQLVVLFGGFLIKVSKKHSFATPGVFSTSMKERCFNLFWGVVGELLSAPPAASDRKGPLKRPFLDQSPSGLGSLKTTYSSPWSASKDFEGVVFFCFVAYTPTVAYTLCRKTSQIKSQIDLKSPQKFPSAPPLRFGKAKPSCKVFHHFSHGPP